MKLKAIIDYRNLGEKMYLSGTGYLGLITILSKDFVATRPPPWQAPFLNVYPALAYISGGLLILVCALALANKFKIAGLTTMVVLFFFLATCRHLFYNHWQDDINGYKSLWFIAGAFLIMSTTLFSDMQRKIIRWASLIIIALFFAKCSYAHFKYADIVKDLIPVYIPFRVFWTYFAAMCLASGAIGILIPKTQSLATFLSGIMIFMWFIILHIPRAISLELSENIGVGESLAISGIMFMLYGILNKKQRQIYSNG
ncbi:MAG: hypothetical protein ABI844_16650 [Saprospiraceae bacterium]